MTRVLPFPYRSPDHGIYEYPLDPLGGCLRLRGWTVLCAVDHSGKVVGAEVSGPADEDDPERVIARSAAVERLGNLIYGHGWADGPQREHGRVYAFPRAAQQSGG